MRFYLVGIFFCLLLNAAPVGSAMGVPCFNTLSNLLSGMINEASVQFVKSEDDLKLNEIFNNTVLSKTEKARQAFDVVLNARLRLVPEKQAKVIKEAIQQVKINYSQYGKVDGYYMSMASEPIGIIHVTVPEQYASTIMEYYILTHEIEHALQDLRAKDDIWGISYFFQDIMWAIDSRFKQEEGAMLAEWAYLHTIPTAMKKELVKEVEADNSLGDLTKKFILTSLEASPLPNTVYLDAHRAYGRYSYKNVVQTVLHIPLAVGGTASLVSIGASYLYLTVVCQNMIGIDGSVPNTKFFNQICLKLDPVRQLIKYRKGLH